MDFLGALNANGLFAHPQTHSERGTRVGEVPEHEIETNLDGIVAATVTQNSIVVITISGAYQKTQDFGGAAAGSSIRNVIVPSAIYAERGDRCDRPAERKEPRAVKKIYIPSSLPISCRPPRRSTFEIIFISVHGRLQRERNCLRIYIFMFQMSNTI